ncbi:MAG: hypothetical protein AABX38_05985 [Candidatus Micrarchaeota archaeon]
MQILCKPIIFILFLFILSSTSFSDNTFSRLRFVATNQFSAPLENVSFFLQCNVDSSPMPIFPMNGKTFICQSNKAGICDPGACFACSANSTATVYADYYGEEVSQSIIRWQGYRYYTDCYAITAPANTLSPFIFRDYELIIQLRDQNSDYVKGANIIVSSLNYFYATCQTDEVGECILYNVPQGTSYNVKATYNDAQIGDSFALNDNKILKLIINIKPKLYNLEFRFFDKNNKPVSGFELFVYSNTKSAYLINIKSTKVKELVQMSKGDSISYIAKYQNNTIKTETFTADSDKNISIILSCELCNDGVCKLSCALPAIPQAINNSSTTEVNISINSSLNITQNNISLDDFLYIINKIDLLVQKEKQKKPKLKLVFVPIGYNETDYEDFKQIAQVSVDRFLEVSPLRECSNPRDTVDIILINLSSCNINGCSEICDDGTLNNCQVLVQKCVKENVQKYDKIIGLCEGNSCGSLSDAGCANQIPGVSAVLNTQNSLTISKKRVTHELGHIFGLSHIKSKDGLNGCIDDEQGACIDPNGSDCSLSAEEISKNIMAYCPIRETYGPAGYRYLKNIVLYNYTKVCK